MTYTEYNNNWHLLIVLHSKGGFHSSTEVFIRCLLDVRQIPADTSCPPYIYLWSYTTLSWLPVVRCYPGYESLSLLSTLTLYQRVRKWRQDGCLLWSMHHVALAPFLALHILLLLSICLLMFLDTFSCNTSTNLSPLAAAPAVSHNQLCCCSFAHSPTVCVLLLKYLAPTAAH